MEYCDFVNLKIKSEYTFRECFAPINKLVESCLSPSFALADRGTWGHIVFAAAAKRHGVKPIFGCGIRCISDKTNKQAQNYELTLLARNNDGLKELYQANTEAYDNFYYVPRLELGRMVEIMQSGNLYCLSGSGLSDFWIKKFSPERFILEASLGDPGWSVGVPDLAKKLGYEYIPTPDNSYINVGDRAAYQVFAGRNARLKNTPQHVPGFWDYKIAMPYVSDKAYEKTVSIASDCVATLPLAQNVSYPGSSIDMLDEWARAGAQRRGIELTGEYLERYQKEMALIEQKGYVDYFLVIADMIRFAKRHMMVGPSRGSSAGSLVCYLVDITEVDPIPHGLIFERFIDINREDLPDIDIDFPDSKREMVIQYLRDKYGAENVAHLGTVSRYKAKSAITDASKELGIPVWEVKDVKDSIIERSSGDARSGFCIRDTFDELEVGKQFIEKYPEMEVVAEMEGVARHTGVHAAGIIVCNSPVSDYCSHDTRDGHDSLCIDKKDAEKINMLKIDCLGLRTLSVIEQCCQLANLDFRDIYELPLNDERAFSVFNSGNCTGIFQFEGFSLFNLTKIMGVKEFNDIVALTSLARPGPLHSGSAMLFVNRRLGREDVTYFHEQLRPYTEETQGTVVYQEQVMNIAREIGDMSWEDVSELRKAMSKSLGDEFFSHYWEKFLSGSLAKGLTEDDAKKIWENMQTFGSWAFNKSHAVSYGLISYWCAYLKANHPLEFAAAQLINVKDQIQGVKLLRELSEEGYEFVPFDKDKSGLNWEIHDGKLVGGLMNIKGVGPKKAEDILRRREKGIPFTPAMLRLLTEGETPYDHIFEGRERFGDVYENPNEYNIKTPLTMVKDIGENGEYVFLAKINKINLRDLNEYNTQKMRTGEFKRIKHNNLFLNMVMEDDTDDIIVTINRFKYQRFGKKIVESNAVGKWFVVKGFIRDGWRKIYIEKLKPLEEL